MSLVPIAIVVALVVLASVLMGHHAVDSLLPARAGGRRARLHRRLGGFLRAARRILETRAASDKLTDLSYMGALPSGRRARVTFDVGPLGTTLRAAVSTTREAPPLSVRLEGALDVLQKRLGRREDVVTGDWLFDERFYLESSAPVEGRRALRAQDLRLAITEAFARFGAKRLALRPGELVVEADLGACPPAEWKALLVHLDRAATLVETRPMQVRVLDGERAAACDAAGHVRCAYCRDGLTGDEDDLVACERCRTALHGACWDEHGGCPMLGCDGDKAERGRARA